MATSQEDRRSLRMAIVRALQLADAQDDHLVAALLAQALDAAEHAPPE
jgi:hypothetical protein